MTDREGGEKHLLYLTLLCQNVEILYSWVNDVLTVTHSK